MAFSLISFSLAVFSALWVCLSLLEGLPIVGGHDVFAGISVIVHVVDDETVLFGMLVATDPS